MKILYGNQEGKFGAELLQNKIPGSKMISTVEWDYIEAFNWLTVNNEEIIIIGTPQSNKVYEVLISEGLLSGPNNSNKYSVQEYVEGGIVPGGAFILGGFNDDGAMYSVAQVYIYGLTEANYNYSQDVLGTEIDILELPSGSFNGNPDDLKQKMLEEADFMGVDPQGYEFLLVDVDPQSQVVRIVVKQKGTIIIDDLIIIGIIALASVLAYVGGKLITEKYATNYKMYLAQKNLHLIENVAQSNPQTANNMFKEFLGVSYNEAKDDGLLGKLGKVVDILTYVLIGSLVLGGVYYVWKSGLFTAGKQKFNESTTKTRAKLKEKGYLED